MGAGKTTVGKVLSKRTSYDIYSLDEMITIRENATIPSIFKHKGEAYFRHKEYEVVKEVVFKQNKKILDCGGGIVEKEDSMKLLKKSSTIIWLNCSLENITSRINGDNRPLFTPNKNVITNLYKRRCTLYEKWADIRVNADQDPLKVASEILFQLQI
ncbi:shikimate kinase [Proteinivorax tanatarense]|uniref:Shikimate kinase n=1 Tax=Proteinivorax tanatarense TaxID=1260629 RepID=A0AAU7VNY9_9FIRM